MSRFIIFLLLVVLSGSTFAGSFRCARKIIRSGESINALVKKCGDPAIKYTSKEMINIHGQQKNVSVTNWVYERRGKQDVTVSVRSGSVVNIHVD